MTTGGSGGTGGTTPPPKPENQGPEALEGLRAKIKAFRDSAVQSKPSVAAPGRKQAFTAHSASVEVLKQKVKSLTEIVVNMSTSFGKIEKDIKDLNLLFEKSKDDAVRLSAEYMKKWEHIIKEPISFSVYRSVEIETKLLELKGKIVKSDALFGDQSSLETIIGKLVKINEKLRDFDTSWSKIPKPLPNLLYNWKKQKGRSIPTNGNAVGSRQEAQNDIDSVASIDRLTRVQQIIDIALIRAAYIINTAARGTPPNSEEVSRQQTELNVARTSEERTKAIQTSLEQAARHVVDRVTSIATKAHEEGRRGALDEAKTIAREAADNAFVLGKTAALTAGEQGLLANAETIAAKAHALGKESLNLQATTIANTAATQAAKAAAQQVYELGKAEAQRLAGEATYKYMLGMLILMLLALVLVPLVPFYCAPLRSGQLNPTASPAPASPAPYPSGGGHLSGRRRVRQGEGVGGDPCKSPKHRRRQGIAPVPRPCGTRRRSVASSRSSTRAARR